jgi:CHASE2 domain-containing sensor protein
MKGMEEFTDLIAIAIGMVGALAKGLKKKLKLQTIAIGMVVAGILSYSLIGVVELFYSELTPKLIILVSFVVGWVANELTEKIDLVFNDLYEELYKKVKNLLK